MKKLIKKSQKSILTIEAYEDCYCWCSSCDTRSCNTEDMMNQLGNFTVNYVTSTANANRY